VKPKAPKKIITEEDIEEIIDRLSNGMTLKQSCEKSGHEYTHIVKRIHASESLTQLHAQARIEYARYQVQRMHDIAETEQDVNRAKLKIDVIKWESARVLPKEFGDRIQTEHTGANGGAIEHKHEVNISAEEAYKRMLGGE
jgi:hypothetical protein